MREQILHTQPTARPTRKVGRGTLAAALAAVATWWLVERGLRVELAEQMGFLTAWWTRDEVQQEMQIVGREPAERRKELR